MRNAPSVELTRDCLAVQIPGGSSVTIPAGTSVDITQTLGGSCTIRGYGGLYRIAPGDADALGLPAVGTETAPAPSSAGAAGPVEEKLVWETLKTCFDPEIPVNIVDLGLV